MSSSSSLGPDSLLSLEAFKRGSRVPKISIAGNGFGPDPRREAMLFALAYTMRVYVSSRNLTNYIKFSQILWCFNSFNSANYALSEVHNPARTLRIAGPLSLIVVAAFYLLCNIAYYAAASKEEITSSGRLVAALLFRNVWGPKAEIFLNAFIALSALGNVLSVVCLFPRFASQQCLSICQVVLPRPSESSSRQGWHSPIQLILGIQLAHKGPTRGPWS